MRVAKVIGRVTLSTRLPDVPAGQFLIVQPLSRDALTGRDKPSAEPVVAYDERSASIGDRVAISEGREAAAPFHPNRVPFDAYCAAIMDTVHVDEAY